MAKKRLNDLELEDILEHWEAEDESDGEVSDNNDDDYNDSEVDQMTEASEEEDEISDENENADMEDNEANFYVGKDSTIWNKSPPPSSKIRSTNILKGKVDAVVLPPGATLSDVLDCFKLFINDEVCDEIIRYTNEEGSAVYSKLGKLWHVVDKDELLAFIGLLIIAGHMKSNNQSYKLFWDKLYGITIFKATMSAKRFEKLLRILRFDNKSTRSIRRQTDKLAPIRSVWDKVNHNFGKYYMPTGNIVVDEQLLPCRIRCPFIQYMPSKPDKYGIKIWWLCDSANAYPLRGIPYTGKDGNQRAVGLAKKVVEELCEPYHGTNRNVTMDNYFTSKELAESLLSKGLTLVGTLRKNKTCIPPEFLPNKSREINSTIFGFQKHITIASHVPKARKAVIFMSTMHHDDNVFEEKGKQISEINKFYNKTKGGVDTFDQLIHEYMIKRKCNRWPLAFFMNLIDAAGIASYIIWIKTHPEWHDKKKNKRYWFLRELGESLVESQIQKRQSAKYMRTETQAAIKAVLPPSVDSQPCTSATLKRKRCHLCPTKISKMQKQICNKCKKNICNQHSTTTKICEKCNE